MYFDAVKGYYHGVLFFHYHGTRVNVITFSTADFPARQQRSTALRIEFLGQNYPNRKIEVEITYINPFTHRMRYGLH